MDRKKLVKTFEIKGFDEKSKILQNMIGKFASFSLQYFGGYYYLYDEAVGEKDDKKLNEIYSSILDYIYENKQMKNIYNERKKKKSLQKIQKQEDEEENIDLETMLD